MRGGLISSRILKAIAIQQSRLTINAFVDRNLRGLTRSRGTGNSLRRATSEQKTLVWKREKFFMAIRAAIFVALIGTVAAILLIMFAPDWVVTLLRAR
jgi:hypothetical protein